jgi:alkaline phosphatase D
MKILFRIWLLFFLFNSCGSSLKSPVVPTSTKQVPEFQSDFILAFGSCNRQELAQPLWEPILQNKPDIFLWGGDNIYADTEDMEELWQGYEQQLQNAGYQKLVQRVPVTGVWDDHDYGVNDGGADWEFKEESQQLLLDFLKVPENDPRRDRAGVYHSKLIETPKGSIKLLLLDTRYFRSELLKSNSPGKRYQINKEGTVLGEAQWNWLEAELEDSKADFHIILSSIQVLAYEHGFESWGNFPKDVQRLKKLLSQTKPKNLLLLSGDRHISEFSQTRIQGLNYPLTDFTSSGLTHVYSSFSGEPNRFRKGEVVSELSFGLVKFNFDRQEILLEMRGEENHLQQFYRLKF